MDFSQFNLDQRIVNNLNKNNIIKPTLIQQQMIPLALKGSDILAKAPTGTGKTAAFAVPIVENMINNTSYYPTTLIISPTRELSKQITDTFKFLIKKFDYKIISIIGGESIKTQLNKIQQGVDIIVSTPGRLVDLIKRNAINLESIKFFVLDEVDLMLDMGFIHDIKYIRNKLNNKKLQTYFISATIPNQIKSLSKSFLKNNYVYVETERQIENKENIKHNVCYLLQKDKPKLLIELIKNNPTSSFIVFINTKKVSNYLSRCLFEAKIKSQIIHGDKTQAFREKAIKTFKKNNAQVLIATDVASRGIDIPDVNFVINYDIPNNKDIYTHRVGRTGRANNKGIAYTFVTDNDIYFLIDIYKNHKEINFYNDSQFCLNLDVNKIYSAKPTVVKRKKVKDNLTTKEYFNTKTYETKKDLKRKKGIEEFNKRVTLNKNVKEFKWGKKENNKSFDNNKSKNNFQNKNKIKLKSNSKNFNRGRSNNGNNRKSSFKSRRRNY